MLYVPFTSTLIVIPLSMSAKKLASPAYSQQRTLRRYDQRVVRKLHTAFFSFKFHRDKQCLLIHVEFKININAWESKQFWHLGYHLILSCIISIYQYQVRVYMIDIHGHNLITFIPEQDRIICLSCSHLGVVEKVFRTLLVRFKCWFSNL